MFDLSNYREDTIYYNNTINLVVDKIKHETFGAPINGFLWIKLKMYIFVTEDNHESKKIERH